MHNATIRAEFERYCQTRVDVEGRRLSFDPTAVTADAEWVKHRLAPATTGLPASQCLFDLPRFQTTAEFLPVHRQQAQFTRELLNAAEASGRQRQADNHREVLIRRGSCDVLTRPRPSFSPGTPHRTPRPARPATGPRPRAPPGR